MASDPALTISIKVSWASMLEMLMVIYSSGDERAKAEVMIELRRMAQVADKYVAEVDAAEKGEVINNGLE